MHEMSRDVQFYQADNLLAMPDKNFVNVPWLGYIRRNKAWIVSLTGPFNFIPKTTNKAKRKTKNKHHSKTPQVAAYQDPNTAWWWDTGMVSIGGDSKQHEDVVVVGTLLFFYLIIKEQSHGYQ